MALVNFCGTSGGGSTYSNEISLLFVVSTWDLLLTFMSSFG